MESTELKECGRMYVWILKDKNVLTHRTSSQGIPKLGFSQILAETLVA